MDQAKRAGAGPTTAAPSPLARAQSCGHSWLQETLGNAVQLHAKRKTLSQGLANT